MILLFNFNVYYCGSAVEWDANKKVEGARSDYPLSTSTTRKSYELHVYAMNPSCQLQKF